MSGFANVGATAVGMGLRLRNVGCELGGRKVLDGLDLDVSAGEWVAVIGPNGAGKTTVLRAVAGLQRHTGAIQVGGRDLHAITHAERARVIALVPQDPVIPAGTTVLDYILLGRTPHLGRRLALGAGDLRVGEAILQRLDLETLSGRFLTELSGGERQRVVIGRALAQQPTVLLLDEPTSSLDLGHQQEVLELVNDLRSERDLTVVMTMHDLSLAGQFADRLALLADGVVAASGAPVDVLDPAVLRHHYGAEVAVLKGPSGPVVVPVRRTAEVTPG
jgi:iron complex transport system ATP-binding protein